MQQRRVLKTSDLVIYGIVLIQPIAPVGIFGLAGSISKGHVATTILIALVAMMITALSYGRLAARFPSSGSAYTYVSRAFHPLLGFLVGWAMFLDYLIIPVVSTIYGALTLQRLLPQVPFIVWAALFAAAATLLNVLGVTSLARANQVLLTVMTLVIAAFTVLSVQWLYQHHGWSGVFSLEPFYNPATFDLHAVMTATSLAALTYIGFDGLTTLTEDVRKPGRSVPLATVLVCFLTGIFSTVEVYLGQRVQPDYRAFPNLETAFLDVTRIVGGSLLFQAMGLVLVVACLGSALTGQAAAARLLYSMGRDNVLPRGLFGHWDARRAQPTVNLYLVGALALIGTLTLDYERSAALLNFGAFLAFMGVNLAVTRVFWSVESRTLRGVILNVVLPFAGFVFCLAIWWSLPKAALIAGLVWFALGFVQVAIRTRGFQRRDLTVDFSEAS